MNTLKNKSIFFILLMGLASLISCKKEVLFEGGDSYITSFSISQSGTTLYAAITDQSITIKAPENFSLDNAKVTAVLSENAAIYPDPSSITDWNDEMQFVVTAHNGKRQTYKYTVVRSSIDADQTIVLPTQADVDAFGKQGITEIKGSLIIGRNSGKDSINNLAALYQLKKIGYSLTVYPTYSGTEFVGLDQLQSVGGDIQIASVKNLEKIVFSNLETAGSILIKGISPFSVEFPALTKVSKALSLDGKLAGISFPGLAFVGGSVTVTTSFNSAALLSKISFPALKEAGNLSFQYFAKLAKIDLPVLQKTGDLNMVNLSGLYTLICPKLETATGKITIPTTSSLREVSFPLLVEAGGLSVETKTLNTLEFPRLNKVSGILKINNVAVNGIKDFTALTEVSGELYLGELSQMTAFNLPAGLKKIGKLTLYNRIGTSPSLINIKGLAISELNLQTNGSIKLIGEEVFKGTLTVNPSTMSVFPVLEGFSEIDSLSFGGYISNMNEVNINGIKKINKSFLMPYNNMRTFSMPDLEEVKGNFTINQMSNLNQASVEFPKLNKIGGDYTVQIGSTVVKTLKFMALNSVGGSFTLGTGYSDRTLSTLSFPALEKIGKKLSIQAQIDSDWDVSSGLTNLDGLSALKNVEAIEVKGQSSLLSYLGLKNAYPSLNAKNWSTMNNAYNPTYEDLKTGNWTK